MSRLQRGHARGAGFHRSSAHVTYHRLRYNAAGSSDSDIFAVNPLRRSFAIAGVCWAIVLIPTFFLSGNLQASILIGLGWLAAAGIVFVTPIFIWCLAEVGWQRIRWRISPTIEDLDLSPRAFNLLRRHGFETISSVDLTPDVSLMLLSNMDARALHEIRRAISIWKYRRWQEAGFPAKDMP